MEGRDDLKAAHGDPELTGVPRGLKAFRDSIQIILGRLDPCAVAASRQNAAIFLLQKLAALSRVAATPWFVGRATVLPTGWARFAA